MKTKGPKKEYIAATLILLFFPLMLCYQELVFHIFVIGPTGSSIVYPLLFAFFTGSLISMIWNAIPARILRWLSGFLFTLFFILFFQVHVVYHSVFVTFWAPFSTLSVAGQAFDYGGMIHDNALANNTTLMLLSLPMAIYLILWMICFRATAKKAVLPSYISCFFSAAVFLFLICNNPDAFDCTLGRSGLDEGMATVGAISSSIADGLFTGETGSLSIASGAPASSRLAPKHTPSATPDDTAGTEVPFAQAPPPDPGSLSRSQDSGGMTPEPLVTSDTPAYEIATAGAATALDIFALEAEDDSVGEIKEEFIPQPQVMDIDFEALAEEESNKNVKNMHLYFATQEPSYTNEYTGMFEGYNLIWITVEGMCKYIIDKERTPTLYMMTHEGFDFTHYYTPLWYGSTSGGEWAVLTGTPPGNGGYIAMEHSGTAKTNMYFTPSMRLGALGYECAGFHANYADYYGRNKSHTNMGLKWIAYGTGYKGELWGGGKLMWPQSDLNLWNESTAYLDFTKPFYAYYMTISGHAQYNWGGNAMCSRHKDLMADLPYSDKSKAYLACEYEVELMLTQMLADLSEAGILDKTVIVLTADHVPYNDMDICDELAGHELEQEFEQYENALIIWSGAMTEPVVVDKYCSSIDILPTVLNLFGVEYDSRLMAGRDILSDSPQLVMFNGSRSFISEGCMYNAKDGSITPFAPYTEEDISSEYISAVQEEIKNKARLASLIIDNNYYDKLSLPSVPVDVLEGSD